MTKNYVFEAEGKSKLEAEETILKTLRLSEKDVKFEVVESGRGGFLGLTQKKPAVVRAYPAHDQIPLEKIAHGMLITLLKKMGIQAEVVGMGDVDGKLYIELSSKDSGIIIGKRGTTLDAIQFLLNIMIDPKIKGNKKIIVDIESYRDKRELALVRLGRSIANSVAKTGRSRLLEPMNPYERRIIHIALQKDERVFTRSEGTGTFKRVRIISVRERHKYKDLEDQVEQVSETEEEEDEES